MFNTRSETAADKPLFCSSIQDRRRLSPASCYFEWKKENDGKKTKYAFSPESGEPLYLAGLYIRSSQQPPPCFTILTQDAADAIKDIHGRMPVILPAERIKEWLSPNYSYEDLVGEAVLDLQAVPADYTVN